MGHNSNFFSKKFPDTRSGGVLINPPAPTLVFKAKPRKLTRQVRSCPSRVVAGVAWVAGPISGAFLKADCGPENPPRWKPQSMRVGGEQSSPACAVSAPGWAVPSCFTREKGNLGEGRRGCRRRSSRRYAVSNGDPGHPGSAPAVHTAGSAAESHQSVVLRL